MPSGCRHYCLEAVRLSRQLIQLARDGSAGCEDDRSLVLFGIVLDTGTRLMREAQKRLEEIDDDRHRPGHSPS